MILYILFAIMAFKLDFIGLFALAVFFGIIRGGLDFIKFLGK